MRSVNVVAWGLVLGSFFWACASETATNEGDAGASNDRVDGSVGVDGDAPGSDGGVVSSDGSTPSPACEGYANALCAHMTTCRELTFSYASQASCVADQASLCRARGASPGTGFTPAVLAACTNALTTAACNQITNPWRNYAMVALPECRPSGARAKGATCAFDSDCASATCEGVDGCGTCANASPPPKGPAPGIGASCAAYGFCKDGTCLNGTCVAFIGNGGACAGASGAKCEPDATCRNSVCTALTIAAPGANLDGTRVCGPGSYARSGKCVPRAEASAACDGDWGCATGLACLENKCVDLAAFATTCR